MELYLRWLNKYERMENEESPVALILCAEKSDEVIKLLELDKGDIRVSQYLTAMSTKEELKEKLHLAIERAKILCYTIWRGGWLCRRMRSYYIS